jgi:hypothetical protein
MLKCVAVNGVKIYMMLYESDSVEIFNGAGAACRDG